MKPAPENRFTVRLGRIHAPSGSRKFVKLAGQVRRAARRFGRASSRSNGSKQRTQGASYFQRRVIVKISIVKMTGKGAARQAAHVDYIARESAAKERDVADGLLTDSKTGDKELGIGRLYDASAEMEDGKGFVERTKDDPHQFRLIVSPEDSAKMKDLTLFTRDLMSRMEKDLSTKLDWVAANHYDTATPHVHIVVSGRGEAGKRLRMPRKYISYGIREQAERLVNLELGPMPIREAGQKLARQVTQERLTALDRGLLKCAEEYIVDVGTVPRAGESWTRRLDIERLKVLSKMGLAEKQSPTHWALSPDLEDRLRSLGERGDIIKAYHKTLQSQEMVVHDLASIVYEPKTDRANPVIGKVMGVGVLDDISDRAYCVLGTIDGRAVFVKMGNPENIEDISAGDVIAITPNVVAPKPSDKTIDNIASRNGGIYSLAAHMKADPSARPEFLKAHIRRLEALRRFKLVMRQKDGSWRVPVDYYEKVTGLESQRGNHRPVNVRTLTRGNLQKQARLMGRTWLDQQLMKKTDEISETGFGGELKAAMKKRRAFLFAEKITKSADQKITKANLDQLERRDVEAAGRAYEGELGKPFALPPKTGRVSGKLFESVDRPSGRYAIVERAKDFTLVPWRDVLEKRKGMEISGQIRNGQINWELGRKPGLGIT